MVKWYKCTDCKTLTKGFPATLRNKCLVCRNIEIEIRYIKEKYTFYSQITKRAQETAKKPQGIQVVIKDLHIVMEVFPKQMVMGMIWTSILQHLKAKAEKEYL